MHKRQAVDEYRYIVARFVRPTALLILIDYLQAVVVNVLLVKQVHVFRATIIAFEDLNVVVLYFPGFLGYALV